MARVGLTLRTFTHLAWALFFCAVADAQTLQRLTVTQLVLGADTLKPKLEQPFRLVISAHVRERVNTLDNLDLPVLGAAVEILGDEHSLATSRSGTDYREIITVVAHHTGTITIDPVTLDAVDARNGKPTRFSSNSLTLNVGGGTLEPTADAGAFVWKALRVSLFVLGAGFVVLIVVLFLRRPRRPVLEATALPPPVVVVRAERSDREILGDALTTLRAERTRATAMRVRHVARSLVGAGDTETLADVLRRPAVREKNMSTLLSALERAAFTYDEDIDLAIRGAIEALEGVLH